MSKLNSLHSLFCIIYAASNLTKEETMANKFYKTFFLFSLVVILTGCTATNPPPSDTEVKPELDTQTSASAPKATSNEIKKLSKQEIIQLQQQLSTLGYKPGAADGKLGKGTLKAIKKFQQENNLAETGHTDTNTISMVEQKIKEQAAPPTPQAPSPPASTSTSQDNAPKKEAPEPVKQDNKQVEQNTDQADQTTASPVKKLEKQYENLVFSTFTAKPEIAKDSPKAVSELQHSMMTALQMANRFKKITTASEGQTGAGDTLIIKADITELRIVPVAARMWAGPMAGSSGLELNLQLIDSATQKVVRDEKMSSWNNAFGASYSGTDETLVDDMGKIVAQYIIDSMPTR